MANYKSLFTRYLDMKDIRYSEPNDNVVRIAYSGDNLKTIPVFVFIDEDGEPIFQFKCWDIANFKGKEAKGIMACNDLNNEYRWVSFSLDKDADIIASIDAFVTEDSCGEIGLALVRKVVNIVDDAYPTFAKSMWS